MLPLGYYSHPTATGAVSHLEQLALVVLPAVLVDALAQESVEPLQLLQAVAGALLHHQVQEVLGGDVKNPTVTSSSSSPLSRQRSSTNLVVSGGWRFKAASCSQVSEDDTEGYARLITFVRAQFTLPLASLIKNIEESHGAF